ncbi:MAG TPA: hypothetical protein VMZ71_09750 [Gemmataceae bacterium]|nr:hypothetical protein [Gemmataceae bacterium]
MQHTDPLAPVVAESKELTDAELEAVTAGKQAGEMEGRSGWFVPLPSKVRSGT